MISRCKRKWDDFKIMRNEDNEQEQKDIIAELRSPGGKERVQEIIQKQVSDARVALAEDTLERINKESSISLNLQSEED